MRHSLFIGRSKLLDRKMATVANAIVDKALDSAVNNLNPASFIPKTMETFVNNEKMNLQQIATNFLPRHFDFRTKDREKKLHVVQLMSEYVGNFSTPVCYLQFYLKRAAKFIRFAENLGTLDSGEEMNRINCIETYKDIIQRYAETIGAIQAHENACDGRLFRRSVERMQPEIAHVPMNLHLQQLLVSSRDDPSQKSIYNTVTLGAPAVHHSQFAHGGLARMKANAVETNDRLCSLQNKLQDVLIINSDIDDALDHLSHIIENPSTNMEYSVLRSSLQRVMKAVFSLLEYSSKDLNSIANSAGQVVVNPLISRASNENLSTSHDTVHHKAKKLLEEIKVSMNTDEQKFDMLQLKNLRSIAEELEHHTCIHIMRYIFQESQEIERYPQVFRERFDIAFSQALRVDRRTSMIPVLRSIDSLLNRFDELSQRHAGFVSNFETSFTDIENPLRDVARDENEQRRTTDSLQRTVVDSDDQLGTIGTVEDFNRRIMKSQSRNRPPSYSSNDNISITQRAPSRNSWTTTVSAPPPRTLTAPATQVTIRASNSQPMSPIVMEDHRTQLKSRLIIQTKPKVLPQNPPPTRRDARSAITTFTMETAIRLSRPKTYNRLPEPIVLPKRVHRILRPPQTVQKEVRKSPSPSNPAPQISPPKVKRTHPTILKSSPKKLKADDRFMADNSKRIPMSNYPRPVIFLTPPPTICLAFPMQPELNSSRVVVIPKTIPISTQKTTRIFTNKRSVISSNRLMYLMT